MSVSKSRNDKLLAQIRSALSLLRRAVVRKHAIRTSELRGLRFFALSEDSAHPFVVAVRRHVAGTDTIEKTLASFYGLTSTSGAAEYLGLTAAGDELLRCPSWAAPMPWEDATVEENVASARRGAEIDAAQYGMNLRVDDGWTACGPANKNFVDFEAQRLKFILRMVADVSRGRSIQDAFEPVKVIRLRKRRRSTYLVVNGQHRAAVYAALGEDTIRCIVKRTVDLKSVGQWGSVQKGLYSRGGAELVWRRIEHGRPPSWADEWLASLDSEPWRREKGQC